MNQSNHSQGKMGKAVRTLRLWQSLSAIAQHSTESRLQDYENSSKTTKREYPSRGSAKHNHSILGGKVLTCKWKAGCTVASFDLQKVCLQKFLTLKELRHLQYPAYCRKKLQKPCTGVISNLVQKC